MLDSTRGLVDLEAPTRLSIAVGRSARTNPAISTSFSGGSLAIIILISTAYIIYLELVSSASHTVYESAGMTANETLLCGVDREVHALHRHAAEQTLVAAPNVGFGLAAAVFVINLDGTNSRDSNTAAVRVCLEMMSMRPPTRAAQRLSVGMPMMSGRLIDGDGGACFAPRRKATCQVRARQVRGCRRSRSSASASPW